MLTITKKESPHKIISASIVSFTSLWSEGTKWNSLDATRSCKGNSSLVNRKKLAIPFRHRYLATSR
jgi:hypothetical protein